MRRHFNINIAQDEIRGKQKKMKLKDWFTTSLQLHFENNLKKIIAPIPAAGALCLQYCLLQFDIFLLTVLAER